MELAIIKSIITERSAGAMDENCKAEQTIRFARVATL